MFNMTEPNSSGPEQAESRSTFGLSNVWKSLAKGFKSVQTTQTAPFRPTVVGGTAEMLDLMKMAANESLSPSERIKSSELLRASLETHAVSSLPEIWYVTKTLINNNQTEVRRAGLKLMISCIYHDEPAIGSRMSYYKAIIDHKYLSDFDLLLAAMKCLTNDGRDVYEMYQSEIPLPRVLISWLKVLFNETDEIRKHKKTDFSLHWGCSTEENFHELVKFIINTLKFNSAAYSQSNLESLLKETVKVCQFTLSVHDVSLCCDLINTIMTYSYIPHSSLRPVIEVLCGIHATVNKVSEKSGEVLFTLTSSHLGNSTVLILCGILDPEIRSSSSVNANTMRGAVMILTTLEKKLGAQNDCEIKDVPISAIFSAFRKAAKIDSAKLRSQIASSVYKLLSDKEIMQAMGSEVWEITEYSPLEVIYQLIMSSEELRGVLLNENTVTSIAPSVSSSATDKERKMEEYRKTVPRIYALFDLFDNLCSNKEFTGSVEVIYHLFLHLSIFIPPRIAIRVMSYYSSMNFCNTLTRDWESNLDLIMDNFYNNFNWPVEVRLKALNVLKENYQASLLTSPPEISNIYLKKAFQNIDSEVSVEVLNFQLDDYVDICQDCSYDVFLQLTDLLMQLVPDMRPMRANSSLSRLTRPEKNQNLDSFSLEKGRLITRAFAVLFVKTFRKWSRRARNLYFNLVTIAQRSLSAPMIFIEAARLLSRLRCTESGQIFLSHPTNMDGLAASVGRGASFIRQPEQLWWLPENHKDIAYFSPDILDKPSLVLRKSEYYNVIDDPTIETNHLYRLRDNEHDIDIDIWLTIILDVFEIGASWEIYSFLWAHFAPQLSNLQLFYSSFGSIQRLWRIMSEQILSSKVPASVQIPKELTKLDSLVAEIRSLSSLLGYKSLFTKPDHDLLVQALVSALNSWEKTAVPCITALLVCCYEISESVELQIIPILTKFSMKITTAQSSPYVLEFLLTLSRIPQRTNNKMTQEDFKRIFAIAFKYIQHANDSEKQAATKVQGNDRIMSQYLLATAYNVISNWFLALPISSRRGMATYITRNLILADGNLDYIDEQSLATLDLISRFAYSDIDLIQQTISTMSTNEGSVSTKRWILGKSVISIQTDRITGDSQIIVRRPTGTAIVRVEPDSKMLSKSLIDNIIGTKAGDNSVLGDSFFSPNYFLLQLFVPNDDRLYMRPLLVPDEPAFNRGISAIDRAPVVDFHKVGILYIAPGQKSEAEILGNQFGSAAYKRFMDGMGTLVKLKGNKQVYTGGLDTEMDIDGEFAYAWNDKITQVIYHTTTMMPPPRNPADTAFASKKRHIGNDYICVFFDESGHNFDFNVISTQFTFINIVVTPHTLKTSDNFAAGSGRSNSSNQQKTKYYKVRAFAKDGIPSVFAAMHLRVLSEDNISVFVRNLALVAGNLATVYSSGGKYMSNWRYRLQQINQLKERVTAKQEKSTETAMEQNDTKPREANSGGAVESAFLTQLAAAASNSNGGSSSVTTSHSSPTASVPPASDSFVSTNDIPLLKTIDFISFT